MEPDRKAAHAAPGIPVCRSLASWNRIRLFSLHLSLFPLTLPQRPTPRVRAQLARIPSPAQSEGVDGDAQGTPSHSRAQGCDLGSVREQGGALVLALFISSLGRRFGDRLDQLTRGGEMLGHAIGGAQGAAGAAAGWGRGEHRARSFGRAEVVRERGERPLPGPGEGPGHSSSLRVPLFFFPSPLPHASHAAAGQRIRTRIALLSRALGPAPRARTSRAPSLSKPSAREFDSALLSSSSPP